LILAIPLAITANMLTPCFQRWWATTSARRRAKRISVLKQILVLLQPENIDRARFDIAIIGLRYIAITLIACCFLSLMAAQQANALHSHVAGFNSHLSGDEFSASDYQIQRWTYLVVFLVGFMCGILAVTRFAMISSPGLERLKTRTIKELQVLVDNSTSKPELPTKPLD
jgi:hypothetical protein